MANLLQVFFVSQGKYFQVFIRVNIWCMQKFFAALPAGTSCLFRLPTRAGLFLDSA